jgi:hypothetical protein
MASKSFRVRFYVGVAEQGNPAVSDIFLNLSQGQPPHPHLQDGTVAYEMRDLVSLNGGQVFRGVLAVLRDDAPNIREAGGAERPIALAEDEHIIEKNHFLYYSDRQLLAWQVNGRGSHISRMEKYLSFVSQGTIGLADVIQPNALHRLQAGAVKKLKVRIARSQNAAAIDPHNWEASTFDLMNGIGASSITVEVSAGRALGQLNDRIGGVLHRLLDRDDTRALQVTMNGEQEPIDLFADCITDRITVPMLGVYPVAADIFAELEQAKQRNQAAFDEHFGQGNNILE